MDTVFVTDGGAGDAANIAGTTVTADDTVGPDGSFLPAGFRREGDGSITILAFNNDVAVNMPEAARCGGPVSISSVLKTCEPVS